MAKQRRKVMNKIEKEVLSFSKTISKEDIPNLQEKVNEIIKNEEFQKLEPEDTHNK